MPSTSFYVSNRDMNVIEGMLREELRRDRPRYTNRSEFISYTIEMFVANDISDIDALVHEVREIKKILSGVTLGQYSYQQIEQDVQKKLSLIDDLID